MDRLVLGECLCDLFGAVVREEVCFLDADEGREMFVEEWGEGEWG